MEKKIILQFGLMLRNMIQQNKFGGLETIEVDLPAIVTVDLRLNEPRYVKLPDIMKAKKKTLDVLPLGELGIGASPALSETRYEPPAARQKGIMVEDIAGLITALKDKGLV